MTARRRSRARTLTGGAVTLVLVLSGAAASAQAAPAGESGYQVAIDGPDSALLPALAGAARLDLDLTLVTGDRVRVGLDADGAPVVRETVVAPRAGGAEVAFHTITRDGQTYVVPADALSLVAGGVLDLELFNLAKLAAHVVNGTVGEVPVIVTHTSRAASRSAPAVPGATVEKELPSIHATSQTIDGDGQWWRQVAGGAGRGPAASSAGGPLSGVDKVWLNELATVQLEDSVPMVEAPTAWDAGYDGTGVSVAVLDTGVDPDHPDLAGQVVAEADFTGNPAGARDGHGHGTHVAATVAGTGAASDGLRPGVAPGADLLIGKVCNDAGSCPFDAMIAGMEWAASSGARVVSMSIGGGPTDGTDPLSQAVNQLSRATGVLFVIAAGNGGPAARTVSTPGTADEALTVAAVDDAGEMADFSGRGPRPGDAAAKPDIAAPGVSIVAARAAGTAMGQVEDEHYTAASGTSMATPHVAGAAAAVTQRFPDLTGREIKALLMDAAVDLGHDLFAQGEGLLDVAAATDRIVATGGPVSFGRLTYPHQPVTRTVTYTNLTDQPVPLSLAATLASGNGTPAPDGLVTVTPAELTVPAGGTGSVTLTLDGRVLGEGGLYGRYRGALTATDATGAVRASDRVTALLEAQRHEMSIGIIPPEGATDLAYGGIVVLPVDDQVHLHDEPVLLDGGPSTTTALYAGAYAVATSVSWRDAAGERHTALVTEPEVTVAGPTPVRLDLREAQPVAAELPEPAETYSATLQHRRTSATGDWSLQGTLAAGYGPREPHWWTLPTEPVRHGTFHYLNGQVRVPPLVTMQALGGGSALDLHPRYVTADLSVAGRWQTWGDGAASGQARQTVPLVPHLPARGLVPVVYAGAGTPGELAGAGVDGALVLLNPADICDAACDYPALKERVGRAAERGAVGVIVAGNHQGRVELGRPSTKSVDCGDGPESCPDPEPYSAVPLVSVPATEATRLVDRLGRGAPVRVRLGGEPEVPEVYALSFVDDRVPSALPHRVREPDLERVEHRIHGTRPGTVSRAGFQWARAVPALARESEPLLDLPRVATGRALTMLVGPRRAEALDRFRIGTVYFDEPLVVSKPDHLRNLNVWTWPTEVQEVVVDGPTSITWNSGPMLPGIHTGDHTDSGFGTDWGQFAYCAGCREGDRFWPVMTLTGSTGSFQDRVVGVVNDTGAGFLLFLGVGCEPPTCTVTLYDQAGEEIPQQLVPIGFAIGGNGSAADSGR